MARRIILRVKLLPNIQSIGMLNKEKRKEWYTMAKSWQEKNRMECNRRARKKYDKENFKYQSVLFKIEEIEAINDYCERNHIQKNTFFRETCMNAIGRTIN